jgi:hypothetical protein
MRRQEFITLLGAVGATWSVTAGAQQSTVPLIGFLSFAQGLRLPLVFIEVELLNKQVRIQVSQEDLGVIRQNP